MQELKIICKDGLAKDLILKLFNDQGAAVEQALAGIAQSEMGQTTEPKIMVLDEDIVVESIPADKGLVWAYMDGSHEFVQYSRVDIGQKYVTAKNSKLAVFVKAGEGKADVIVGYAPTITEALVDIEEHAKGHQVEDVKQLKKVE